jgi:hypothetical protein
MITTCLPMMILCAIVIVLGFCRIAEIPTVFPLIIIIGGLLYGGKFLPNNDPWTYQPSDPVLEIATEQLNAN